MIVQVVAQRHDNDCAVACLAMLTGKSYEDVLLAMGRIEPTVIRRGAWTKQIEKAARALGTTLQRRRQYDLDADSGILCVKFDDGREHVVFLTNGVLVNTDSTVWEPDVYFRHYQATPGLLLVKRES